VRWRETEFGDVFLVERQWRQGLQDTTEELRDTPAQRESLQRNARTWVTEDDRPLAIVGIAPLWKGVGQAWGLLSQEALDQPVALSRGVLRWLSWVWRSHGYHRIQADVEVGHKEGRRLLVFLGFTYEGRMYSYGPAGLDHDLYAILEDPWPHR
jgi:hypothetical protein